MDVDKRQVNNRQAGMYYKWSLTGDLLMVYILKNYKLVVVTKINYLWVIELVHSSVTKQCM